VPGDRRRSQERHTEVRLSLNAGRTHPHLVASLVKLDDDRLQALLDEIQTMRKFQS
jgi:hypothetical protein